MEREWKVRPVVDVPADLLDFVHQNMTVASYLVQRDVTTKDQAMRFLKPDRKNLADPYELPDMQKAVDRVIKALTNREQIGIWGDFDVDGQTATAVLVECLTKLGGDVTYYLPVRGKESHGISIPSLSVFLDKGIQLLITCDTGVSEHDSIKFANEAGIDVIVTDHHTLPDSLPPAMACVNPRRLPESHALGSLSGSGAAFELMLAVCRTLNREEIAFESVDLAAIGLIADLAPLKNDSRLLAQLGLLRLSENPRHCIKTILEVAKVVGQALDEQTIGFTIAPRLNAIGRLDNANPMVDLLMDSMPAEAMKQIVERIETINANRKWLCDQVYQAALGQLRQHKELSEQPVIILSHPTWTGGVLGLAAGKLAIEFNRPAIILSESPDGLMRGSARSIEGINITEAITAASQYLSGFGGHPMAAGLSFPAENLPSVRQIINRHVLGQGLDVTKPASLEIDEVISFSHISPGFFEALNHLAPFGNENPPLVFSSRRVQIASVKPLGRNREHFKFVLEDETGHTLPAIQWNADEADFPEGWFDLAFTLRESAYKGETTLQAEWLDHHIVEEPVVEKADATSVRIIDLRKESELLSAARNDYAIGNFLIFQEPPVFDDPFSIGRIGLRPVETLILASIPPSRQVFEDILKACHPKQIVLAFEPSGETSLGSFLKYLAGLIQYAVSNREGLASLEDLAQAMNSRNESVEAGIRWMKASGKIEIVSNDRNLYRLIIKKSDVDERSVQATEKTLRFLLKETGAYTQYIQTSSVDNLTSMVNTISG